MSFDIQFSKVIGERTVTVSLQTGSVVAAIVGPSGAGKTTILNCIAGLMAPINGHIRIGNQTLFDPEAGLNLPPSQRDCGYVFQDSRLFPHLDVLSNLTFGLKRSGGERLIAFDDLVGLLGIGDLLSRKPASLSGGETRRVAIGRALLSGPKFLLLDEPLASLDPERAEQVLTIIEKLRDQLSIPTLYVSHDQSEIARLTSETVLLATG